MPISQLRQYEEARRRLADSNQAFMELVTHPTNPMTRDDLAALIALRPERYGRFAGWLDVLTRIRADEATNMTTAEFVRNQPNPFASAPVLSLDEQISNARSRLDALTAQAETGEQWATIAEIEQRDLVPLMRQKAEVPPDPLRRAAESISLGTKLTPAQIAWARGHDWFDSVVGDGVVIVTDRFTYQGRSFVERLIWGGTFAELRDWAGY